MRQFVFGLLVVGLAVGGFWWMGGSAAKAGGPEPHVDLGAVGAPAGETATPKTPAPVTPPAQKPLATGATPEAQALEQALSALATRIAAGEVAARDEAKRLLARQDLPAELRARLQELAGRTESAKAQEAAPSTGVTSKPATPVASKPNTAPDRPEDLPALMEQLGANNAFLHTADGRALGERVLKVLKGLGDEAAIPLSTSLLERCTRGTILKEDLEAHAFVDAAYAQHRIRIDRFFCDPANLARCRSTTVGKGEGLQAVAARFRKDGIQVEEGTLALLNRIHNINALQVGQRIKAPVDPILAVLEKRSFLLALYVGDTMVRLYWVGHGENDKTPVTEFTVVDKIANPPWYAPDNKVYAYGDPKNILGKYFIKFSNPSYSGFGAHGTPMPETIGTMSSAGCIRMYDNDIEELYKVLPRKAKVVVRDSN